MRQRGALFVLLFFAIATSLLTLGQNFSSPAAAAVISAADPQQVIRGFGMSLSWEAASLYGNERVKPFYSAADAQVLMQLIFQNSSFPVQHNGQSYMPLGMTVARYNIGKPVAHAYGSYTYG